MPFGPMHVQLAKYYVQLRNHDAAARRQIVGENFDVRQGLKPAG